MILIWSVPNDRPAAAVRAALERRFQHIFFLDQFEALGFGIEMSVGEAVQGILRSRNSEIRLEEIESAYVRPYDSSRLSVLTNALPELATQVAAFDDAILCWLEMTSARVVNRPSAMASNQSKLLQLALIDAQGFQVPETLATTDATELEAFWDKHRKVIYKSISGVRSIVSQLTPMHRSRFGDLGHSPTLFQQWIPGHDVRVHVVGDEVFACAVESSADDYRYPRSDEEMPRITPFRLPDELGDRCRRLTASLGLDLAGIDLRRTPQGEWYCFEVNPSPAFTFYADATGHPIDEAIARMLVDEANE